MSFGGAGLLPILGFAHGAFMALKIIQGILVGITALTVAMVLHFIAPRWAWFPRAHGRHQILTPPRRAGASVRQLQDRDPVVVASAS